MSTSFPARKKVLIVPLDWGLGHATRDIPLIHELLNAGCEVVIAAEGKHAALLSREFPQLTILPLPGYHITYSQKGLFFGLKILQQVPKIWKAVKSEQAWLRKTVIEHGISAVISDNRFGLYHSSIPCVFISHQLLIKTPFGGVTERLLQKLNYRYIRRYSACWIPDFEGEPNLSGALAHPPELPGNTAYLGCLSRFEPKEGVEKKYDLLALISGPEPQRTNLEELLLAQIKQMPGMKALIVSGRPDQASQKEIAPGITQVSHLGAKELNEAMLAADMVLSRSGYTTLMDLAKLNKKGILIPTPGQSEQEYLGKYLMKKGYFYSVPQSQFNLRETLNATRNFPFTPFQHGQNMEAYKKIVQDFVKTL
ncbi:glycosyltransferase [Chitinophaga sp. 22620]|uniref:glycosyltransferase n=1 Tax=Chitinophaga sp. 22620 TaxID=3453952 RepID=UPI003F87254C